MYGFADLTDDGLDRVLCAYQRNIDLRCHGLVKKDGKPTAKLAKWIASAQAEQTTRGLPATHLNY